MSAARLQESLDARLIIGGRHITPSSRDNLPLIDPATESELGRVPIATAADLDAALEATDDAFAAWARTPPGTRGQLLLRVASILAERGESISKALSLEQGKVLREARAEVDMAHALFTWFAGEAARMEDRVMMATDAQTELRITQTPVGPTAVFTPWNFPLVEPAAHLAAALSAGATVILKVSEETPVTGCHLLDSILDAGLPPGVAQLVVGDPASIADHLIASPTIRKIAFTGSVPVGKRLAAKAAALLKPSTMELGGNAPAIVCDDVDVEQVAGTLAAAKCRNAGQVCTVPNRVYVHESVFDAFVSSYVEQVRLKRLGPGTEAGSEMGPLAHRRRIDAMDELIVDLAERDVPVVTGGRRADTAGFFYENTVVARPPEDARCVTDEIFGPITPLLAFQRIDEVIDRSNAAPVGLSGYVFSSDRDQAEHIASRLDVGNVAINHTRAMYAEAPFGGTKDSGHGRIGGREGLAEYLVAKTVSVKHDCVRSQRRRLY